MRREGGKMRGKEGSSENKRDGEESEGMKIGGGRERR